MFGLDMIWGRRFEIMGFFVKAFLTDTRQRVWMLVRRLLALDSISYSSNSQIMVLDNNPHVCM